MHNPSKTGSYVVYDLFEEGTGLRTLIWEDGHESRLEKYLFQNKEDGTVEFIYQEGWWAGSHYDGATAHYTLPEEWLSLSWTEFLDVFCEKYPKEKYSYGKEELAGMSGLRNFLGLA